ncbi:MAG: FkbM family methyltransferase [Deltaproteobacteria bacterium]|nr:FkbM family methyltransferase [Deltaproteobacteria bacterium]MBM4321962.1 FkbM family methyltransferase [Deltaproteobacteria bacterium]
MRHELSQRLRGKFKDCLYRGISDVGYRLTPRSYLADIEMWYHLRKLFARQGINTVLDVGANEGQYRNFLRRRCGFNGWIVSFEPVRSVFEVLKTKAKVDHRWLTFNCAIGSQRGRCELNVMRDTHFSSFLDPLQTNVHRSNIIEKNVVERRETVEVQCLSDIIPWLSRRYPIGRIYLKTDTQGHDLEVLRGARGELNTIVALQIEVPVKPVYNVMPTFSQMIDALAVYGFDVTGMFVVSRDELMRVIEFDCVAVNNKMVSRPS